VSAHNDPHNIGFTTQKENRNTNSRKRKAAVPKEWKINKTKLLQNTGHTYRTFSRGTDIPEWKLVHPMGPPVERNVFFRIIRAVNTSYFQKTSISGRYQSTNKSQFKCVNVTLSKTRKCLKLLQNVLLK
jgi:hypothetical protein